MVYLVAIAAWMRIVGSAAIVVLLGLFAIGRAPLAVTQTMSQILIGDCPSVVNRLQTELLAEILSLC